LVGLPPRTPAEAEQLGPDWRALYLRGKAGLVSEVLLHPDDLTEEEAYALEGVYAVTGGPLRDLGLLARYFLRLLFGRRRGPAGGEPPSAEGSAADRPAAVVVAVAAVVPGKTAAPRAIGRHQHRPVLGPHRGALRVQSPEEVSAWES
jgi:hypothetical protein